MILTRIIKPIGPALGRAGLIASVLLLAGGVTAQDALDSTREVSRDGNTTIEVALRDDLVTLSARSALLRDVLAEIVRQCDLMVVSYTPLDNRITLDVERVPLVEALVRIMRDQSYMLHQAQTPDNAGQLSHSCGGTLWVFSDDSSDGTGYSLSATSLAIEMLRSQLNSDDIRVRQNAIKELRKLDVPEVIGPLSNALSDEDRKIRVEAVYALADIGGDDAIAVLAAGLADENASVRAETAYALGSLGSESAISMLKHALNDTDSRVRTSAISAFTEIGGAASAEALAVALQDADLSLRVEAIEALANVGGKAAVRLLNKALQDQDDTVREAAREAFAGMSHEPSYND